MPSCSTVYIADDAQTLRDIVRAGAEPAGRTSFWGRCHGMGLVPTDLSCEADAPAALLRLLHGARREAASCTEIAAAVLQAWDITGPERHAIARLAE
jgi:hypothetical protein